VPILFAVPILMAPTVGCIYGPNEQNPAFYNILMNKLEEWDLPFIIGGDFNTILDRTNGEGNLDRIVTGRGRVPNLQNSNVVNGWIEQGKCIEPFRALYPEQQETSYIPFRAGGNQEAYGKTRLDFFLVSVNIINVIADVTLIMKTG
jgi:hypothetical protein